MDLTTLINQIRRERARLDALIHQATDEQMQTAGVAGEMSLKDILAHVTWYESQALSIVKNRALVGSELWSLDLEGRNAAIQAQSQGKTLVEVLVESNTIFSELMESIQTLSEEELHETSRFRAMPANWIPWQVLASNTTEHYLEHIPDIESWLARQQH